MRVAMVAQASACAGPPDGAEARWRPRLTETPIGLRRHNPAMETALDHSPPLTLPESDTTPDSPAPPAPITRDKVARLACLYSQLEQVEKEAAQAGLQIDFLAGLLQGQQHRLAQLRAELRALGAEA